MKELDDLQAALDATDEPRRTRDAARDRLDQEDTPEHRAALDEAQGDLAERISALEPLLNAARRAIETRTAEVQRKREALDREIVSGSWSDPLNDSWSKPLNELISDREALLVEEQMLTGKTRAEIGPLPARATRA